MLSVVREKVVYENVQERVAFQTGDMVHLPFDDNRFDVVLSTYSLCPLYDPLKGALELYRATEPGGRLGLYHLTEPKNVIVKHLPISLNILHGGYRGCRWGVDPSMFYQR